MGRNRPELFKGRHFEAEIMVLCVRWYLRYPLSLRQECDRLSKLEIECARRADAAQSHLRSFVPEAPSGAEAAAEFQRYQHAAETYRASAEEARRKRVAHSETHVLTVWR